MHTLTPQPDNSQSPPQIDNDFAEPFKDAQKASVFVRGLTFVLNVKMVTKLLSHHTPVATLLSSETENARLSLQPSDYPVNERSSPLTQGFYECEHDSILQVFMFVILTTTGILGSDISPSQPPIPSASPQTTERKLGSLCSCLIVNVTMM